MRSPASNSGLYPMTATAILSAVLAVISPFALFLGPVPISLCTLLLYLSGYLVGWKHSVLATLLYLLLGMAGLPVFSGFSGGLGKVLGPTGGYLLGYLTVSFCSGFFIQRFPTQRLFHFVGMALGTAALYGLGTIWFCIQAGQSLSAAIALCVVPFLPGDLGKIAAALVLGPLLRRRLTQAGL